MMEKTKAQKDAQKKYMEKFNVLRVRMDHEKAETVKAHAEGRGHGPGRIEDTRGVPKRYSPFFMGPARPGERGIFGISGALKKAGSRAFLR